MKTARDNVREKGAFTLVELLVVVAVILILASLLVPAMRQATDSVRLATCLNNLRQIATACFAYAADHDGLLPYGVQAESWGWRWETCLIPYLGLARFTNGDATSAQDAFYMIGWYNRVITKPGVLKCPSDDPARIWSPTFIAKSYSGNSGLYYDGPLGYGPRIPLSSVAQPALTALNVESWGGWCGMNWGRIMVLYPMSWNGYGFDMHSAAVLQQLRDNYGINVPQGFINYIDTWGGSWTIGVPAGYPHHRGKMNLSICDGSARTMKYEDTFYPTNYWSMVGYRKILP